MRLKLFPLLLLLLTACNQNLAQVEMKGDKFYGFDANALGGNTHIVQPRESISVLAKRYHTTTHKLAAANHLTAPYVIKAGQKLYIPSNNITSTTKAAAKPIDTKTYDAVPAGSVTSRDLAAPATAPGQEKIAIITKNQPVVSPDAAATPTAFSWPVKGQLLLHFGPGKGGYFNDGINIAAVEGTDVTASANGKVVYAGNELRGYGNLLIIRHDNGLLTAYAHQKDIIVKKGDMVKQGQTIGHVGTTGNVSVPQLHFGIRNGKNPINPEEYLPK